MEDRGAGTEDDRYGPWMLVTRRKSSQKKKKIILLPLGTIQATVWAKLHMDPGKSLMVK